MQHSICPWWLGYVLASPVRKLIQNPDDILRPYVKPDMKALDVGCAMGFFTLPMARLVGPLGKVIAVDLQEKMLASLRRRATRAKLSERMEFRKCSDTSLGIEDLAGTVDFALIFAVLHEMPDQAIAFGSVAATLRPGALLLVAEPTGHVSPEAFEVTLGYARDAGLAVVATPAIKRSLAAVLQRKE